MYRESLSDPATPVIVESDRSSGSRLVSCRWFIALMALLLLLPALGTAQAIGPDDIVGNWEAVDETLKLEMFHIGSDYEARMLYENKLVKSDGATFKRRYEEPGRVSSCTINKGHHLYQRIDLE